MSSYPPEVPPPPDRAPASRPGIVTAAGVLLIVGGALGILFGLVVVFAATRGPVVVLGLLLLGANLLQLYAGFQVLALREVGRQIGLVLAIISGVLALLSLGRARGGLLNILIDIFIIYALATNAQHFSP